MNAPLPKLQCIKLHRPVIFDASAREAIMARPDVYPHHTDCCYCKQSARLLVDMWPVEFVYLMPGGILQSQYVYACSEAHAAQFMLSWWEEPPAQEFHLNVPAGI